MGYTMTIESPEKARFIAFCIEYYRHRHGGDGEQIFDLFTRFGVVQFLLDHFDVEHCLDPDQITDDIEQIIRRGEAAA